MNKNLYHKEIEFPEDMREHLKICFVKAKCDDPNNEGIKETKNYKEKIISLINN